MKLHFWIGSPTISTCASWQRQKKKWKQKQKQRKPLKGSDLFSQSRQEWINLEWRGKNVISSGHSWKKFFGLSLNFDQMLGIFHKRIVEFDVNTNYLQSGTCCYYYLLARVGGLTNPTYLWPVTGIYFCLSPLLSIGLCLNIYIRRTWQVVRYLFVGIKVESNFSEIRNISLCFTAWEPDIFSPF